MGQATVDLPDPLQDPGPGESKSADELLSQLAGDEIDRLLAENESEPAAPAKQAVAEPQAVATEPEAVTTAAVDLDAVLESAAAERVETPPASSPGKSLSKRETLKSPSIKDTSPQIELGEPRGLPLFLRPLEWISAPLDPWPDLVRETLGKIGILTLVNALAVLAYVLLVRRHRH
jgi:hypothetical protein